MTKLFSLLFFLLLALPSLAQTPSNAQILSQLGLAYKSTNSFKNVVGGLTTSITSGGSFVSVLSKSGSTGQSIYTGICAGCMSYDNQQSVLTIPSGSTVTGMNGYGSYIINNTPGGAFGNGVNYFSVAVCATTGSNCWGSNPVLTDSATQGVISSVTGVKLIGSELDFTVASPHTIVQGISLLGSSLSQPAGADGFTCGSLSVQDLTIAKWSHCFVVDDGTATVAAYFGALAATGSSVASQQIQQGYRDSSGVVRSWEYQVAGNGSLTLSDSGSGHAFQVNDSAIFKQPAGSPSTVNIDNGGSQISTLQLEDGGTAKWQVGKDASNNFFAEDVAASATVWSMPTGGALTFTPPVAMSKPVQLASYTVSTLPACSAAGSIAYVTDATSPTYNGTLTGGGSVKTLAMCNGSAWVAH